MRVTIEYDSGVTFSAAFQDDTDVDDIAELIRTTLAQQAQREEPLEALDNNIE